MCLWEGGRENEREIGEKERGRERERERGREREKEIEERRVFNLQS